MYGGGLLRGTVVLALSLLVGPVRPAAADGVPEALRFFGPFFLPKMLQDLSQLDAYVRSDEFRSRRAEQGDPAAVDALYARALDLAWGNTGEALLIAALVTMEHRRVAVKIPVLGLEIPLPLTAEFPGDFNARVGALPGRLYEDSPPGAYGDRDKLQHFFGSAFLTLVAESEEVADAAGRLVERGESRWVPGEIVDARDIRANRQGQRFGRALLEGSRVVPSQFLRHAEEQP